MPTVDDYIASLEPSDKAVFGGMVATIMELIPSAEQGTSYGMPAFLYRGKPLVSFLVRKNYLSLYPFSGKVVELLKSQLGGFEITSGSIHFTVANPIGDSLLAEILNARAAEIDASLSKREPSR